MEVMLFPATGWRSPEEYVEIENLTDSRNEYWNGKIVALGGSPFSALPFDGGANMRSFQPAEKPVPCMWCWLPHLG